MRKGSYWMAAASLAIYLFAGCAAKHTVVLVPDPDGHTGKAVVTTEGGSQVLKKSNDLTRVSGSSAPPSPVTTADPGFIASTFADALAIEPLPSEKFTLFFETGKTEVTQESQRTFAAMLETIKRRGAITISVSGHTDASGSAQFNEKLAYDRADLVKDLLLQNGVDPEKVAVSSHGKGNPLVPTPDGVPEPRNRRVEVIIR